MLHAKSKYCLVSTCIHKSSPRKISSAASCQPQFLYQAGDLSLLLLSAWFHHGETLFLNINDIISSNQLFVNVNNYVYFRSRKGPHMTVVKVANMSTINHRHIYVDMWPESENLKALVLPLAGAANLFFPYTGCQSGRPCDWKYK